MPESANMFIDENRDIQDVVMITASDIRERGITTEQARNEGFAAYEKYRETGEGQKCPYSRRSGFDFYWKRGWFNAQRKAAKTNPKLAAWMNKLK